MTRISAFVCHVLGTLETFFVGLWVLKENRKTANPVRYSIVRYWRE